MSWYMIMFQCFLMTIGIVADEEPFPQLHVSYELTSKSKDTRSTIQEYRIMGEKGFIYLTSPSITTSDGTIVYDLFIRRTNSSVSYFYRTMVRPSTSSKFLQQANGQGSQGRRLKFQLEDIDGIWLLIYVRDHFKLSANYTYRHGLCVDSYDELDAQIKHYAADGYRFLRNLILENFCSVYIKDQLINTSFHYERAQVFNTSNDLIAKANELGSRGYRLTDVKFITLKSNGSNQYGGIFIFYRDLNQPLCTFTYVVRRHPNGVYKMMNQLQQQERQGFLLVMNKYFTGSYTSNIYVKMHRCQYESIDIDDID